MLTELHTAIQNLLYQCGNIPADAVDVRFELPSRQWADSLVRPTVSVYLFDVQENTELRHTNVQTVRNGNSATLRMPPRRVDLRFMVSVLTTVVEDEHLLLWRVLATLMKHAQLPEEVLSEELRAASPPISARVSTASDGPKWLDLWSALGLPPRPALLYVVTVPLDLEFAVEAPLVLSRSLRVQNRAGGSADELATRVGGVVRDAAGNPLAGVALAVEGSSAGATSDTEGRYVLRLPRAGTYTVFLARPGGSPRPATLVLPAASYDLVVEET